MSLARLVVIEGPDAGRELEIPMRGGKIGRADECEFKLSDPTVSRTHGLIDMREGALCFIPEKKTVINGSEVSGVYHLQAGDEIAIGATKLAYLPSEGVALTRAASNVTMEVGSRQLLSLTGHDRARRHLAAIAQLGDRLRGEAAAGRDAVARAACDAARTALEAHRAFVLSAGKRPAPVAASMAAGESAQLQLPQQLVDKVIGQKQVVTADSGGRALIAAPIHGGGADEVVAILWVDRKSGTPWEEADSLAANCLAHLTGAAWAGADTREQLARKADALEERLADGDFVGKSAAAHRVIDFVKRVGPSDATILLGGESGSGKEMVARAIHRASRRANGPCVAVNCAALTESLIESELFGHEKGAFTGATEKKAGRFEMADRGTLFLDEVGELPLGLQTKFLRVLEERRFERVGGQKSIEVDVRVVAATNRDLAEMVKRGQFREDLYYRLSVIHVDVPPLRERLDDVPLLAEHFLARFRQQAARRISGFAADAIAAMTRYSWPGNVRELRNAVERAIVLGDREQIVAQDLPPQVLAQAQLPRARLSPPTPPLGSAISTAVPTVQPQVTIEPMSVAAPMPMKARSLRELEKEGILAALAATNGNKAQAAALLEIDRSTLYKKLKDYGIEG
jgi:DNA-binding NtrC family response regulator